MPSHDQRAATTRSLPRILWTIVGEHDIQIDSVCDINETGLFVVTDAPAPQDYEIRFDLLNDAGGRITTGLGRVVAIDTVLGGMSIAFVTLGIDNELVLTLSGGAIPTVPTSAYKPPPLPVYDSKPASAPPLEQAAAFLKRPSGSIEIAIDELDDLAPQIEPLDIRPAGIIIGIDLGTTNTCASYVVDGRPKIIPGRTGTSTIPSMITFEPDGTFHIGQRAADRQIMYPLRTVYGSKRLIGRTYRPELAAELQKHFAYPLGEAEGQRFGVRVDERVISMDTIAARVLDEVRSTAEEYLKQPVKAAVITVPAYFSEVQREAVRSAARLANLTVHRIVNEPTAAAVAYGAKKTGLNARVAVWDFGGGTFDFSIVDVEDGQLSVVATGGDNFVGGSDFNDYLASYLLSEFQAENALLFDPDPQQIARLRDAAEQCKKELSHLEEWLVELPEFTRQPRRSLSVEVSREKFEQLIQPLISRTLQIAKDVMNKANIAPEEIDDIVLVGGTTRVPAVQNSVAQLFKKRPNKGINPDEAVALGAAILASEIGTDMTTLLDILPMTVGYGAAGGKFVPIVPQHSRLPAQNEIVIKADMLGWLSLPIFQGDSSEVSKNEYISTAVIEDRSLWDKGSAILTLSFDEHCVMSVEAKNAKTKKPLPVRLDRSRSVEEILRELGTFEGPKEVEWRPPESTLGKVLGKLFSLFGR